MAVSEIATPNWAALMPPREPVSKHEALPKVNNMTPTEQELCYKAERLIAEGDLDAATAAVRQFERVVKARTRHKVTVEHDDGDPDDWSEEATAPDGDGEDPSSDSSDDSDDDEDDGIPMKTKKGFQGSYNLMDHGHNSMQAPRSSSHTPAYSGHSATSATTAPRRHKFDAMVEKLCRENNVSKTSAMQMCRRLYPELFRDFNSSASAQVQQASRSGTNEYAKSRGASYEDLLGQELVACNGNEILAKQQLLQRWGNSLHNSVITKSSPDLSEQWQSELEDIVAENDCTYCEAAQHLRKIRPSLFKAMRGD
jgi:hypothetical protein